jgi:hypothetical protein
MPSEPIKITKEDVENLAAGRGGAASRSTGSGTPSRLPPVGEASLGRSKRSVFALAVIFFVGALVGVGLGAVGMWAFKRSVPAPAPAPKTGTVSPPGTTSSAPPAPAATPPVAPPAPKVAVPKSSTSPPTP